MLRRSFVNVWGLILIWGSLIYTYERPEEKVAKIHFSVGIIHLGSCFEESVDADCSDILTGVKSISELQLLDIPAAY